MSDPEHVGYEDLFKPLKDVLLKNWSMSLAHVLDKFIIQLQHDEIAMNFTQAALLLQNSTSFYCKRVDVVFRIMEELTDGVARFDEETPSALPSLPVRRKRLTKVRENDDLDTLDFVFSEHNMDLNLQRFRKAPLSKQLTLGKVTGAKTKPNSILPFSQSSGIFIGHKNDFRLFGKIHADGTINEDFNYHPYEKVGGPIWSEEDRTNNNETLEYLSNGVPSPASQSMNEDELEPPLEENPPSPIVVKELRVVLCRMIDTKPITFNFVIPLKLLDRRRVFHLPKRLIEEGREIMERMKPRKRRRPRLNGDAVPEKLRHLEEDVGTEHCCGEPIDEDIIDLHDMIPGSSEVDQFKLQRIASGLAASEVAQKVSEWQEKVMPRIIEAQQRTVFNVHEYATQVLDRFPDGDSSFRPFAQLVAGQPKHEISRFFLSTLMLANTYNLEIRKSDESPLATDCVELKLSSKIRHVEDMEDQMDVGSDEAELS